MQPGERFGKYLLVKRIGEGISKVVWKATDTIQDRDVALKLFLEAPATTSVQARLYPPDHATITLNEARALTKIGHHPRIAGIYDADRHNETGTFYIAEQLVDGRHLGETLAGIDTATTAGIERIIGYARDILEGVALLDRKGIVHGDIKLENILIGSDDHAVITDFGLATFAGQDPSPGSLRYQTPEWILRKERGPATNAWQIGVLLYSAVTGRYPFYASVEDWSHASDDDIRRYRDELKWSIAHNGIIEPVECNPAVGPRLNKAILGLLEKDPQLRPTAGKARRMLRGSFSREALGWGLVAGCAIGVLGAWLYLATPRSDQRIICSTRAYGNAEIVSMDAEGYARKRLTENAVDDTGLSSSPDRGFVAWISGREGARELLIRDLASGEQRTVYEADTLGKAAWSPDSGHVAVFASKQGSERLVVLKRNGSIASTVKAPAGVDLQWHPAGTYLSYVKGGQLHLATLKGETRVTNYREHVTAHAWTSRGLLLADHRPGPLGSIALQEGDFAEFGVHRIKKRTVPDGLGATVIRERGDKSGYWYVKGSTFMEHRWDAPEASGINLADGAEGCRIIAAAEGPAGSYLLAAIAEDLDGTGTLDRRDCALYELKRKGATWTTQRLKDTIGAEEVIFLER